MGSSKGSLKVAHDGDRCIHEECWREDVWMDKAVDWGTSVVN